LKLEKTLSAVSLFTFLVVDFKLAAEPIVAIWMLKLVCLVSSARKAS
jgi:hypothetical protein